MDELDSRLGFKFKKKIKKNNSLSFISALTGKKDNRGNARDAIVGLRSQLLMLDKKEEHLNKKIEDEMKKAKANASSNKRREFCV